MVALSERQVAPILLIEDDPAVAQTMSDALDSSGYRVNVAETGASAKAMLARMKPALILLDLMLPDVDGLVLCSTLKAMADVPIVICTASVVKSDAVLALKLGADDYIPKPFDIYELEARITAVLRRYMRRSPSRTSAPAAPTVRVGNLSIDSSRSSVSLDGKRLSLTPTEYRLVSALATRSDRPVSRHELATSIWGRLDGVGPRTIDVHVRRVRAKLGAGQTRAPAIEAIRGFGYRLAANHETA